MTLVTHDARSGTYTSEQHTLRGCRVRFLSEPNRARLGAWKGQFYRQAIPAENMTKPTCNPSPWRNVKNIASRGGTSNQEIITLTVSNNGKYVAGNITLTPIWSVRPGHEWKTKYVALCKATMENNHGHHIHHMHFVFQEGRLHLSYPTTEQAGIICPKSHSTTSQVLLHPPNPTTQPPTINNGGSKPCESNYLSSKALPLPLPLSLPQHHIASAAPSN